MNLPATQAEPQPTASGDSTNGLADDASRVTGDPGAAAVNHGAATAAEPPNSRYRYMTPTTVAHGQWLRRLRQAHGWSTGQMVSRLREAATAAGDKPPTRESLVIMIHRWEEGRSGVSEQYRLHYCAAFKLPVDRFGDPSVLGALTANGMSQYGASHVREAQRRSAWDRMQAALGHAGDPAKRDRLCFQLGYLCALMITDEPATVPTITSLPAAADDADQTCAVARLS